MVIDYGGSNYDDGGNGDGDGIDDDNGYNNLG